MRVQRTFLVLGSAAAGIAVILGAFGAHALKARLAPDQLAVFETGVRYQMYHAFALFIAAWMIEKFPGPTASRAGWFFIAGMVLFSGSLYLLSTRTLLGIEGWTWLGPITPLGGLCFIAGWASLLVASVRGR
jgi:uncharacterized membrane protein YgdD (TMEM256/DUF423 family)